MNSLRMEIKNHIMEGVISSRQWKLPTTGESYKNVHDKMPTIKIIVVIGGGTMGAGITIALANADYKVILIETNNKKVNEAQERIKFLLNREEELKRYNKDNLEKIVKNISYTVDLKMASEADLVIEAVFENMKLKKELFNKLKSILKEDCIVGSNTSSLDIDELANSIKPFNFVGIHFFNPPHVVKIIEIVYGNTTKGVSVAVAFEIASRMGKYAILVKTCPGFLFNRLLFVYIGNVSKLINTYGFYPSKIDEIFKKFGFAIGPLTMCDMNGLDVMNNVFKEQNFKLNELEEWLIKKGYFGRKTGVGYYLYDKDGKKLNNKEVEKKLDIIKKNTSEVGGLANDRDIIEYVLFPYINEIFKCLEEGIILCPLQIDLIKIFGLGWPSQTGGPLMWAENEIGLQNIVKKLDFWYLKYKAPQFKGFECRSTKLSNDRLTFMNLESKIASISDILIYKYKEKRDTNHLSNIKATTDDYSWDLSNSNSNEWDLKNSFEIENNNNIMKRGEESITTSTPDTFTVNYDEYGTFQGTTVNDIKNPCFQYLGLGSQIPYTSIDMFAKVIFEVPSYNTLFTKEIFNELCNIDKIVGQVIRKYKLLGDKKVNHPQLTLPYSFNLPLYTFCININATGNSEEICQKIREEDILQLKEETSECFVDKSNSYCRTPMAGQLTNYIIENNYQKILNNQDGYKLKIATIIPIFFGNPKEYYYFSEELLSNLEATYNGNNGIKLVGVNVLSKDYYFQVYLLNDMYLGLLSFFLVVLMVWLYTGSILFTCIVLFDLIFSLGIAFFIYTVILKITFFPFINFLVVILITAIGSDDTFILNYANKIAIKKLLKRNSVDVFRPIPQDNFPKIGFIVRSVNLSICERNITEHEYQEICKEAIKIAFKNSTISMFVTSATTAIAFFCNISSSIVVVKCFGIFAGLTIMVNFFFVISTLPAAIVLINNANKNKRKSILKFVTDKLNQLKAKEQFYNLLIKGRFLILLSFIIIFIFTIISIIFYPGITLPRNNPLQILRSSHSFEWFDEYSKDYFNFENSSTLMQQFNVLFGLKPTNDASGYNINDLGSLQSDKNFNINTFEKIYQLRDIVHYINQSEIRYQKSLGGKKLWIDYYIEYINDKKCLFIENSCCKDNTTSILNFTDFSKCSLEFSQKRLGVKFPQDIFATIFDDGPIFEKKTMKLIAYYIVGATNYKLSIQYKEIQKLFNHLLSLNYPHKDEFPSPIIISSPEVTKVYDLFNTLSGDILISITFSLTISIIVIGFITRQLILTIITLLCITNVITLTVSTVLWMGWKINVLETTIIVLTIGLSFDYTLHSAVAYKEIRNIICFTALDKILELTSHIIEPILCATITNIIVGFVIIWSKTQAFFEVGVFMIIMSLYSLISSIIIFPILMICFGDRIKFNIFDIVKIGLKK
uniref:SSD domain-containing protein n=1 Tax=Strongyloides stercoralis TaxID=6248 RepID=A0AAF5CYT8_STRER